MDVGDVDWEAFFFPHRYIDLIYISFLKLEKDDFVSTLKNTEISMWLI